MPTRQTKFDVQLQGIFKDIDGAADFKKMDFNIDLFNYGITSVNILKLLVELENRFNIDIDDNGFNFKNFKNINSIIGFIEEKQKT